jgi:uncharacterized protein involved in exopolysaccharide biosynthesis
MVDGSGRDGDAAYGDERNEAFRPMREHWAFITVFIVAAMLSALALTYIYSERYLGETTVFFKPADVTLISEHATQAFGSPFPTTPFKVISQTISGLLDSDTVLRRVVAQLRLDVPEPKDYSGPWYISTYKRVKDAVEDFATDAWKVMKWGSVIPDDPMNKAVDDLRRHVKLRNDDSYVFPIQVTDKKPEHAAAEADALAASLLEALRLDVDKFSSRRIADLTALKDNAATRIEGIDARMRDLLASNGIASIQEEIEKVTGRSSQLLQAQSDSEADLRQSEQKSAELAEKLRQYAPAAGPRDLDAPGAHRMAGLTADDYNKLYYAKLSADVASGGLRARIESVKRSIAAMEPRLKMLNQVAGEYDLMSAQLQSAKRDYVAVTDALQEMIIKGTSDATELRIQHSAELPNAPVSPIKFYHVGLAGVLAALVAIGLAYVLDFFHIRLFLPGPKAPRRRLQDPRPVMAQAGAAPADAD